MNRTIFFAASVAFLAILTVPTALAQVEVSVEPPAPLPFDAPTSVPVTVSANCAVVLVEYEAMQKTELQLVAEGVPEWLTVVGDKVPFTTNMCGSDGNVHSTGNLVLTPGPLAPGLEPITLTAMAEGEEGEASFDITVAYRGVMTPSPAPVGLIENGTADTFQVVDVTANAKSLLMVVVLTPPTSGTVEVPAEIDVESPLLQGSDTKAVEIPIKYTASDPMNATADQVTLQVMLHAADDMSIPPEMTEITITFEPVTVELDDQVVQEDGQAPGVEPMLLVGTVLGVMFLARRRTA